MADFEYDIKVVYKLELLLRTVGASPGGIRLSELAHSAGMDVGLTHRYVASLLKSGLLTRHADKTIYIGPLVRELWHTNSAVSSNIMTDVHDLAKSSGNIVALLRWTVRGPQFVWHAGDLFNLSVELRPGLVLPILTTAGGLVCLGFADSNHLGPLIKRERLKRSTTSSKVRLNRFDLDDMRHDVSRRRMARFRDYFPGISAMSCPVYDYNEQFWGVVTAMGLSDNFDWSWRGQIASQLCRLSETQRISKQLDLLIPNGLRFCFPN